MPMPSVQPTDDHTQDADLDPIDLSDPQDLQDEDDAVAADDVVVPDLGPEIEEEIKRVMVVEEPTSKSKNQVIPDALIHEELRPEDFFDEGSI